MPRLSALFSRRSIRSVLRGMLRYLFGKRGQRRVRGWRMFYRLRTEALLQSIPPIHALVQSPSARLWSDDQVFPRIQRLLQRARHTVVIQMFIWKDDRLGRQMASILLQLADRGVQVEISKEAVGDVFEFHRDFLTTQHAHDPMWQRFWHHPNIVIRYGNDRDHAKVFIIDDKVLMLTGMNIADEYHERLHDYLVELRGEMFVGQYITRGDLPGPQGAVRLVMNTDERKEIRPAVMTLLESAAHSIVVEQCYISDPKVLELLARKSREKVRVTLIVPSRTDFQHQHANMQSVAKLVTEGDADFVQVFLYPGMFHGKTILVDRTHAFIGSANLIASSLDEMGEVNVLLSGQADTAILKLRDALRASILKSKPLTTIPRFGWISRILGWLKL
jgi:cardiolipin synthase